MSETSRPTMDAAGWDQRYKDGQLPWDNGEPDHHLSGMLAKYGVKAGKALELGSGTGTNSIWLAQMGFEVTGLDISPTAVEMAKEKAQTSGVKCNFQVKDFLKQSIKTTPFDFAYDRGCFHTLATHEERRLFVSRLAELLEDKGIWHSLIGSTDGPPREVGPPRRSAQDITSAIEPDFEILELSSFAFDQGDHSEARAWVLVAKKREVYGKAP